MHIILHHPTSGEFLVNSDSIRQCHKNDRRTTIYFNDGHSVEVMESIYEIYAKISCNKDQISNHQSDIQNGKKEI